VHTPVDAVCSQITVKPEPLIECTAIGGEPNSINKKKKPKSKK